MFSQAGVLVTAGEQCIERDAEKLAIFAPGVHMDSTASRAERQQTRRPTVSEGRAPIGTGVQLTNIIKYYMKLY